MLQRKEPRKPEMGGVPDIARATSGPGQKLGPEVRSTMESHFGHDFGRVRIYSEGEAAGSASALNALAFAAGPKLVFGAGHYRPETASGRRLIAHELAHVVQQDLGRPASRPGTGYDVVRDDALEREATAWSKGLAMPRAPGIAVQAGRVTSSAVRTVQLADRTEATTTAAPPGPAPEKTALERAQDLVTEAPTDAKTRASWILTAADLDFVTFNTVKAKQNLQDIKDGKKVEHLDPASPDYDVPILEVEVGLVKKIAQRWIAAKGAGPVPSIQFGSMVRSNTADVHGKGKAIDITKLSMATSVEAALQVLDDLDKTVHSSFGVGLPFQGDFFDPADELGAKQAAVEAASDKIGDSATVTDAVEKFASHIYTSKGTKAGGAWTWAPKTIQEAGGAYKKLKSKALKDKLAARRSDGLSFVIFPDNDNHLHLDAR